MADDLLDLTTFDELQESVGVEFVVELVDAFLEEAPPMLLEMRAAIATSDADAFRRAAHSLKTNANTFGAKMLGRKARDLEHGALPTGTADLDAIEALYAASAAALKAICDG